MEILIRVRLFQKLISLHNNMFPGCVFRALFYTFSHSYPQSKWIEVSPKEDLEPWRVKTAQSSDEGTFPCAEANRWPGYRESVSSPVIMSEAENRQGFICRVTLEIFPVNTSFSFCSDVLKPSLTFQGCSAHVALIWLMLLLLFNMSVSSTWPGSHLPISMLSCKKGIGNHLTCALSHRS